MTASLRARPGGEPRGETHFESLSGWQGHQVDPSQMRQPTRLWSCATWKRSRCLHTTGAISADSGGETDEICVPAQVRRRRLQLPGRMCRLASRFVSRACAVPTVLCQRGHPGAAVHAAVFVVRAGGGGVGAGRRGRGCGILGGRNVGGRASVGSFVGSSAGVETGNSPCEQEVKVTTERGAANWECAAAIGGVSVPRNTCNGWLVFEMPRVRAMHGPPSEGMSPTHRPYRHRRQMGHLLHHKQESRGSFYENFVPCVGYKRRGPLCIPKLCGHAEMDVCA